MPYSALARAIFRQEGSLTKDGHWVPASVGVRNRNPGNLAYAGQKGASPLRARDPNLPGKGENITYATFRSLELGVLAAERQIALDAGRGLTLEQLLSKWTGANRAQYILNVSTWLGVLPDTPLVTLAQDPPNAESFTKEV